MSTRVIVMLVSLALHAPSSLFLNLDPFQIRALILFPHWANTNCKEKIPGKQMRKKKKKIISSWVVTATHSMDTVEILPDLALNFEALMKPSRCKTHHLTLIILGVVLPLMIWTSPFSATFGESNRKSEFHLVELPQEAFFNERTGERVSTGILKRVLFHFILYPNRSMEPTLSSSVPWMRIPRRDVGSSLPSVHPILSKKASLCALANDLVIGFQPHSTYI